jgi:hypothetical protein
MTMDDVMKEIDLGAIRNILQGLERKLSELRGYL